MNPLGLGSIGSRGSSSFLPVQSLESLEFWGLGVDSPNCLQPREVGYLEAGAVWRLLGPEPKEASEAAGSGHGMAPHFGLGFRV